jgi:DNA-directed RNA polymerase delta subunit
MDSSHKNALTNARREAKRDFSFSMALERLLEGLSARSRHIARERFGATGKRPKTLEEIGGEYGITRERIRQIIRSVIRDVQARKQELSFRTVEDRIESVIAARSGIVRESDLLEELGGRDRKEEGAVRFFLECLPDVRLVKEDERIARSYALASFRMDAWQKSVDGIRRLLEERGELFDENELFEKAKAVLPPSQAEKETLFHFLAVSAQVRPNAFGKWGLSSWSDVQPKGTREKAYLVLKMLGKPLHFREITEMIDRHGLQKNRKKTHPQTVHNELIKDRRFVLVGRGTYALSEWGYRRGTVREVLEDILRGCGHPMKRGDIIRKVLEMRQVKKSTIVINLNTFFDKVGKDEYSLKK